MSRTKLQTIAIIGMLATMAMPRLFASALPGPGALDDDRLFFCISPEPGRSWSSVLSEAYRGSRLTTGEALTLLILSNTPEIPTTTTPSSTIERDIVVCLPAAAALGDVKTFMAELTGRLLGQFNERVAWAGFDELERRYAVLHDVLFPLVEAGGRGDDPGVGPYRTIRQLEYDYSLLQTMKPLNDRLYRLLSFCPHEIEKIRSVRSEILLLQERMAKAVLRPDVLIRESLQNRVNNYLLRLARFLEEEIVRRIYSMLCAVDRNEREAARRELEHIVLELMPLCEDLLPETLINELFRQLSCFHAQYISPETHERSLAFSLSFNRLASLLAPPSRPDNYRLGQKISDSQFRRLVKSRSIVLLTDCSGFIGRIYRELARLGGLDMKHFVIGSNGAAGSGFLISGQCSEKLDIGEDSSMPLASLLQGDFFYFEILYRGEHQRHVLFFDHFVKSATKVKIALWEASPGGVKYRTRSITWALRRLTSPYGRPRNGAYRLKSMDTVDRVLSASSYSFIAERF